MHKDMAIRLHKKHILPMIIKIVHHNKKKRKKDIKNWFKHHKGFSRWLEEKEFYTWKDTCGNESLTSADVKRMLIDSEDVDENHLPETPEEVLRVWRRT